MTKQSSTTDLHRPSARALATPEMRDGIGLALGGGGARGLAHVAMLEVFDELGIKPAIISGASIGAIYGAAYASGISGRELREHTKEMLSLRFGLLRELFQARAQPMQRLLNPFGSRSALLDPMAVLEMVMPKAVKGTFGELEMPLKVVASDFYDQEPTIFSEGALRPAVAASMALPVIFEPVIANGRAMIDGGLTNPLPFDLLTSEARIVVAIDVTGAPIPDPKRPLPTAWEALFATAYLFENSIVREKLKSQRPDILISAGTSRYQVLDFLKVDEILAAAEPAKDKLKAQLDRVLSVETLAHSDEAPAQLVAPEPADSGAIQKPRRGLLSRRRKAKGRI